MTILNGNGWQTGKLKNKLIAEKVTHYNDDTTHSIKPVMYFYNDKTPPWVVKSETGILSADGKDMFLNGKAVVSRAKAEKTKELIINTSNLRVKPETNDAETDEWAELLSPPNVTTGTGMKMVFVSPVHLELLANVKENMKPINKLLMALLLTLCSAVAFALESDKDQPITIDSNTATYDDATSTSIYTGKRYLGSG